MNEAVPFNPIVLDPQHPLPNFNQKPQPVYNIYNLGEIPPDLKSSVSTSHHTTAQRLFSQNLHDLRAYAQLKYPVKISASQKNSAEAQKRFETGLPAKTLVPFGSKTINGYHFVDSRLDHGVSHEMNKSSTREPSGNNPRADWVPREERTSV